VQTGAVGHCSLSERRNMVRIDDDYIVDIDAMSYTAKKNTHKKDKEGNTIYSTIGSYSNLNDAVKSIYYNKAIYIWYKTIVMLSELGEEMDKKLEELNI
jgi:hypothetical protein